MILNLINKKIFTFGILLLLVCGTLSAGDQKIEKEYKKRLLGEQAFNDGLYDVAINYYKHYLKDAGSNTNAVRDAYYSLIATCLRANNIEEAELFYQKVAENNKDYFKLNPLKEEKLKYWSAEISLCKGLTEKAKSEFIRIAAKTAKTDKDIYAKALIGQGISEIRLHEWKNAEKTFETVYNTSEAPADKRKAREQLILIKLASNEIESAAKLIKEETKNTKNTSVSLRLLNIYSLIKQGNLEKAENEYMKISTLLTAENSTLSFLILSEFADEYIKKDGYNKALDKLQQAFATAPGSHEKELTAILTLNTFIEAERFKEAAISAKLFLDFFPDSILRDNILLTYVDILIKLETDPAKILPIIEKYYTFKSNPAKIQVDISIRIGKVLFQIADYKNALRYLTYSFKNGTTRNQCGESLYWEGKSYMKLGNAQKALEKLATIDSKIPEWQKKATHEIALIYLEQKDYIKAKAELLDFMKKFPNNKLNPPALLLYGMALSGNNELEDAVNTYLKFAEENPKSKLAPEAYCRAGDLCLRLTEFKKSINCYQHILDSYPKSKIIPEVLYKLLYSYYLSGGYSKAVDVVANLNKKYPKSNYSQQASFWLVDYYASRKKYAKAINQLDTISRNYSDNNDLLDRILYEKTDLLFKMGKYKTALQSLDGIINKSKDQKELGKVYYLQGDIYSQSGNYDNAIESYKKVLTLNADLDFKIAAQGRIGDCYFADINFADSRNEAVKLAINAYKELFKFQKLSKFISIQTNYKLGKCYEILGEREAAIMYYHAALYENILDVQDKVTDIKWMAKAGIALARMLQENNTKKSAKSAITVYQTLIKNGVEPKNDFRKKINKIMQKYKIKENI